MQTEYVMVEVRIDKLGNVEGRTYYRKLDDGPNVGGAPVQKITAQTYKRHVNAGVPYVVNVYSPPGQYEYGIYDE